MESSSADVLPEFRAQRKLNEQRIPEIRDYIINNRDSYVFTSIGERAYEIIKDSKFSDGKITVPIKVEQHL